MVEEVERLIPIKCPNWQAEDKASGNPNPAPGLHVAEPFGLTGEGAKGEFLVPLITSAPGRTSSIALPAVVLGEGKL